jgi:hypothetical protein
VVRTSLAVLAIAALDAAELRADSVPLVFEAEGAVLGLYPDDVARVDLVAAPGRGAAVEVMLNPGAIAALAALTSGHVGEELVIRFCGQELLRPRLMVPRDEGRFAPGGRVGERGAEIVAILQGRADCAGPAS